MLLKRVQLREVRCSTRVVTLKIMMRVRRRIHRIEAAVVVVMMVMVLMGHLGV